MKRMIILLPVSLLLLWGCKPARSGVQQMQTTTATVAADILLPEQASPAATIEHSSAPVSGAIVSASSPASPERTPDPSSEMLVTGEVVKAMDNVVRVRVDNLGKELDVTMLDRAEYADGVSRDFTVGNRVRIITSDKLAKTLPERVAARVVLENRK